MIRKTSLLHKIEPMAMRSSVANKDHFYNLADGQAPKNDPEIVIRTAACAADPNSDRSPLHDVRYPAMLALKAAREVVSRGRITGASRHQGSSIWWSQTGSNRRPHACKARALPAELWPRNQKTNAALDKMVGLGRLELPTSRLSSARSNQLSYKPSAREAVILHPASS